MSSEQHMHGLHTGMQCRTSSSLRRLWASLHPQLPVQPLSSRLAHSILHRRCKPVPPDGQEDHNVCLSQNRPHAKLHLQ